MVQSIRQYFSRLPDPRHRRGRRHRLDELVIMAILAVTLSKGTITPTRDSREAVCVGELER